MLGIAFDAAVLMGLLHIINDDDIGFGSAFLVALLTAIGTGLAAFGLVQAMGLAGLFVAVIGGAVALAFAVAIVFGVELKRAALVSVLFMVVHIVSRIGLEMMLSA